MIRKSNIEDLNSLIYLYEQIMNKEMIDGVKYNKIDFIFHINNNIYIYEENNKILGFILFYDHLTWCYVELLVVDEKYRKKGIGKKLLNFLEKLNSNWGCIELCCHSNDINIIKFVKNLEYEPSNQITEWFVKKIKI